MQATDGHGSQITNGQGSFYCLDRLTTEDNVPPRNTSDDPETQVNTFIKLIYLTNCPIGVSLPLKKEFTVSQIKKDIKNELPYIDWKIWKIVTADLNDEEIILRGSVHTFHIKEIITPLPTHWSI